MNVKNRAAHFAIEAHNAISQVRKYTGEPYWFHPQRVASIVASFPSSTEEMIAAAWLHDVVEDTEVSDEQIRERFGDTVALYVRELTNVPASAGNRAARYAMNVEKLSRASNQAQTIKLADLIDNTESIVRHDPKFARVYLQEKIGVLGVLTRGNSLLWQQAWDQVERGLMDLEMAA